MLDTVTLRVTFSLVAFCVLVLFYFGTYRGTRSAFSGWWVLSLLLYLVSAVLFLFNESPVQVVANPLGNTAAVLGSACVYAAGRSLRLRGTPASVLVVPAIIVLAVSLLDDPVHDVWTGGPVYLATICGYYLVGTGEIWRAWRVRAESRSASPGYDVALLSMAGCSAW